MVRVTPNSWRMNGLWDRLTASDPGLSRLSMAATTVIGVASALAVEYGFALLIHAPAMGIIISMMLGAVVTMMGSMALSVQGLWPKIRIAAWFPVAFGIGMLSGVATSGNTDLTLGVFVVVMFAAVAVRKFGIPYFFYGFMGWMGYFFASFISATLPMIPGLLGSVIVATIWVLLLSATIFRGNPTRTLHRTVKAFGARARTVAQVCGELLLASDPKQRESLQNRLHTRQSQLAETALMVEAWSAEPAAMPPKLSAPALRRRLIDIQHVIDRLAAYTLMLADSDPELRQAAAQTTQRLSFRDDEGAWSDALELIRLLDEREPGEKVTLAAARSLAQSTMEFVELARGLLPPTQLELVLTSENGVDEFQPAVGLALGNLPGSPSIAKDVQARGVKWNPLARLDYTTRQAIQAAFAGGLAILAGRELSPARYYWAVIAAFVMFTGTATRTETFLKGLNRVMGTLVGLVAAIGMAELTAGHLTWVMIVILASIFCGFYLVRVSYGYMIFFITIMIGQLYSLLHEFSAGLLILRLEETAVGAVIGFLVALSVIPVSTRDTVVYAKQNYVRALGDFLTATADRVEGADVDASPDFDALTRALDNRLRQLALVAKPLTRPFIWGYSPRIRHRLALYAAIATGARALAISLRQPTMNAGELAVPCRELAELINGEDHREALAQDLEAVVSKLNAIRIPAEDAALAAMVRRLLHLEKLLEELLQDRRAHL